MGNTSTACTGRTLQVRAESASEPRSLHRDSDERIDRGLRELAHAPVIRTVELEYAALDLRLKDALIGGGL